jgi:hypothetical protein
MNALPANVEEIIQHHEAAGTTQDVDTVRKQLSHASFGRDRKISTSIGQILGPGRMQSWFCLIGVVYVNFYLM